MRLKAKGVLPYWCINHGPSTSLYYRDPDGNRLEAQVDNFETPKALTAFLRTPDFADNPIGVPFDPDRLVQRYLAGDSEAELKRVGAVPGALIEAFDWLGPRDVPVTFLRELEAARCQALIDGDLDTVDTLVADDLVHVHANGVIDDKAGYMNGLREKYVFHQISRPDLNVRVFGNAAIMTGPLKQSFSVKGIDARHGVEGVSTQTWIRNDGRWRLASCHNTFQLPA